jgi:hypothetical protein
MSRALSRQSSSPSARPQPRHRLHLLTPACALLAAMAQSAGAVPLDPFSQPSLGVLVLGAGNYTLHTDGPAPTLAGPGNALLATGWYVPQADAFNPLVAVFGFDSIAIGGAATLTALGAHPLALLSRSGITIAGDIDAAGRQGGPQGAGVGGRGGPGGGAGGAGAAGGLAAEAGAGPGGGAGGFNGLGNCSWGEGGAHGGAGSNWNPCRSPASAHGNPVEVLQGGSGGGGSGANLFGSGAGGGGGGGGLELGAAGAITLTGGALLSVAGGAFNDGLAVNSGGGSGGGLLLHAPTISLLPDSQGPVVLDASGFSGGRISFRTAAGTVLGNLAGVSVAGNANGFVGVVDYGVQSPVPEPASAWLLLAGSAIGLGLRRRTVAASRAIAGSDHSGARHGSCGASSTDGSPRASA